MIYDRPVVKWTVYLPDGTTRRNRWASITGPIVGVVVFYEPPYARVLHGTDYFAKDGHSWGQSNDRADLSGAVKEGKLLPDERWEEIRLAMHREAGAWRRPTR